MGLYIGRWFATLYSSCNERSPIQWMNHSYYFRRKICFYGTYGVIAIEDFSTFIRMHSLDQSNYDDDCFI